MFKKTYLESYRMDKLQPLNSGCWHFTLALKHVWFWGLFATKGATEYLLPDHHSFTKTTEHWDQLIENGKSIK